MAFGLAVGFEPWWYEALGTQAFTVNAGSVTGNTVSGAVVNLAIEGIGTGYVQGNVTFSPQGNAGFSCNSVTADYTAHWFGNASIQGGWLPYWFVANKCGPWNTALPRVDDPGAEQDVSPWLLA